MPAHKGRVMTMEDCFPVARRIWLLYLTQWYMDSFRTRHVAGDSGSPPGSYEAMPIKVAEVAAGPVNKILQGDWIWHPNRGTTLKARS